MSELKAKELRARIEALKRGEHPPKLAAGTLADAYEQDTSVGADVLTLGVVTMKPVSATENQLQVGSGEPNMEAGTELLSAVSVLDNQVELENKESTSIVDQSPITAQTDAFVAAAPSCKEETTTVDNADVDTVEKADPLAPVKPVKMTRAKSVVIGLIVVGGFVIYSAISFTTVAKSPGIGMSNVAFAPPMVAPALGPVQAKMSSAKSVVQKTISSSVSPPLKAKTVEVEAVEAIEVVETKAKPVGDRPTRVRRVGAVLPSNFKHLQRQKPTNLTVVKIKKNENTVIDYSEAHAKVVNGNSLIEMLERAKDLN